jgi:hypothetical protein
MTYEERKAMFEGMIKKMATNYEAFENGAMTRDELANKLVFDVYTFNIKYIREGE